MKSRIRSDNVLFVTHAGESAEEILLASDWLFHTFLHTAAEHGSATGMRRLLEEIPSDIFARLFSWRDTSGGTPLHTAVENERDEDVLLQLLMHLVDLPDSK